jgi:hypothetical protein
MPINGAGVMPWAGSLATCRRPEPSRGVSRSNRPEGAGRPLMSIQSLVTYCWAAVSGCGGSLPGQSGCRADVQHWGFRGGSRTPLSEGSTDEPS